MPTTAGINISLGVFLLFEVILASFAEKEDFFRNKSIGCNDHYGKNFGNDVVDMDLFYQDNHTSVSDKGSPYTYEKENEEFYNVVFVFPLVKYPEYTEKVSEYKTYEITYACGYGFP